MQKFDAVARDFRPDAQGGLVADVAGGGPALFRRARAFVSRQSDAALALCISAVLFALSAWPMALVEVPPLQDLPNHLAATTVIWHPDRYPEFVSNGFLKTNAALFTWLVFAGKVFGPKLAAKLFALGVLALNAIVLPRFVLRFGGRQRMLVASLFMWPMVHNWFVSMGMLDFALGLSLSLVLLLLLDRHRASPSWKTAALVLAVSLGTWYAHVFCLMVAMLLVAIELLVRGPSLTSATTRAAGLRERRAMALRMVPPLVPAFVLMSVSLARHVTEPVGAMTGYVDTGRLIPPWELLYNVWAEWMWGFTWLQISTFVPTVILGLWALFRARSESPSFFSPLAFGVVSALFVFSPYIATNWFHVNSRFIPFFWMAALLRVPDRLDKRLAGLLALSAAVYSAGLGVDYVRLDADRAKFTAGIPAVREGARLLPLVFSSKGSSQNTRALLHGWGFYVVEKQTSAPLLFAHSRSFPVMYREPPPPQFNHLVLERFAPSMGKPNWMCDVLRSGGVYAQDCEGAWRAQWKQFWDEVTPRFDHVLMWDPTPEAQSVVPPDWRIVFQQDRLVIYAHDEDAAPAAALTPLD